MFELVGQMRAHARHVASPREVTTRVYTYACTRARAGHVLVAIIRQQSLTRCTSHPGLNRF